jgi:hypothetical protein
MLRHGLKLNGKRLKLTSNVLASEVIGERRKKISIPAGEIITVVSSPSHLGFVDVLWAGRSVSMCQFDIEQAGEEIPEVSAPV